MSPSREVQFLARLVRSDPRSPTRMNMKALCEKTSMAEPQFYSSERLRVVLPVKAENWTLGLLKNLILVRDEKLNRIEDTRHICAMIESLCST